MPYAWTEWSNGVLASGPKWRRLLATLLVAFVGVPAAGAVGATLPPNFQDTPVITGLSAPTAVRWAPDGHIFTAEQSGLVKEYDSVSDTTPTTVLDLRTQVDNYWDRGLLGWRSTRIPRQARTSTSCTRTTPCSESRRAGATPAPRRRADDRRLRRLAAGSRARRSRHHR